ncbi:hypothetical protein ACPA9J_04620 [Pseudomonas aeruginosa]
MMGPFRAACPPDRPGPPAAEPRPPADPSSPCQRRRTVIAASGNCTACIRAAIPVSTHRCPAAWRRCSAPRRWVRAPAPGTAGGSFAAAGLARRSCRRWARPGLWLIAPSLRGAAASPAPGPRRQPAAGRHRPPSAAPGQRRDRRPGRACGGGACAWPPFNSRAMQRYMELAYAQRLYRAQSANRPGSEQARWANQAACRERKDASAPGRSWSQLRRPGDLLRIGGRRRPARRGSANGPGLRSPTL